ncbi:hypothetical protein CMUS01_16109 [Colletotrichum musicola]|uniref:DNA 3'-5' helicase n=1 Tax=Colletotrichum musicola TaxID=2175873 RepID=A0A8H6MJM3_9PEZI|nr:hypothetical protein CMUS01_16109 [Colletotrichum musicola]
MHLKDFGEKKELLRGLLSLDYEMDRDDPTRCYDTELRLIHMALERIKNKAKQYARPTTMSWAALFEANRKDHQSERSRPFHFRKRPATEKRYLQVCLQLMAYIVRVMTIEDKNERPPFRLTSRQTKAYETMMDVAEVLGEVVDEAGGDLEGPEAKRLIGELEKAVLDMFLSVLDHETKQSEYENILVSFIAVLSIRADHGWEDHGSFTPKLSAIAAMSRLFVVKRAVDRRNELIEEKVSRGMGREEAEEKSASHFDLVRDMTSRFLVMGEQGTWTTPMQFLFRLRNWGMAANSKTASRGSVSWDDNDMVFKGSRINVLEIQAMIRAALAQLEALLFRELLFFGEYTEQSPGELGVPEIPWPSINDDASDATIGLSLTDAIYRVDGGKSKQWLFRRVWKSDRLRRDFFPDGSTEPSKKVAYRYGQNVERALRLLLFLVHLSYGQAARAPELLTIRIRNTVDGGVRNVLIDRGLVMIVTGIHKGYTRSEKEKVIHRFLPREVSTPLVYLVWLVLPFWEGLQANAGVVTEFPATLWGMKDSVDPFEATTEDEGDEGDVAIEVGGPDDDEGWKLGPGPFWTPDKMTRILRRLSTAGCGKTINISNWRHMAIALARRYFRDPRTSKAMDELDDGDGSDSEGEDDSPWDLQAGHGSAVAGMVYARLLTEGSFETNERRLQFRHISEEWHRLMGFRSAIGGLDAFLQPGRKRRRPSLHHEAMKAAQVQRWRTLRRVDTERTLRKLYGEEAGFQGVQERALEAIMSNKSFVVVIMGTGGGKSLCFMLPAASCPGGITVVVVPLVALLGDMVKRCRELGISCAEWRSDRVPGQVAIVFVTPESAMSKRFQDFLEGIRMTAQLDRIVIDECHTILEGSKAFRPKLRELGQLGLVGVQMVYLTATLPPSREADFFTLLHVGAADVHVIRTRTTRKNVRYCVLKAPGDEETAETVKAIVDRKLVEYPWPAKVIVYCRTVEGTEGIASHLGCDAYHREVDSRDGKAQRLAAWATGLRVRSAYGEGRVIVATNALGLGIDVPDIRLVLHVGMPYEMADYAQQSGRAGRDGQTSEAVVLDTAGVSGGSTSRPSTGFTSGDYVGGAHCRRVVMDSVMDGRRDRVECEEGEETCDVCRDTMVGLDDMPFEDEETQLIEREVMVRTMRERATRRLMEAEREILLFQRALDEEARRGCFFCSISTEESQLAGRDACHHTTLGCEWASRSDELTARTIAVGVVWKEVLMGADGRNQSVQGLHAHAVT